MTRLAFLCEVKRGTFGNFPKGQKVNEVMLTTSACSLTECKLFDVALLCSRVFFSGRELHQAGPPEVRM